MQGIVECKLGVLKQDIQYNLYYKALNKTRTRHSQTRVNLFHNTDTCNTHNIHWVAHEDKKESTDRIARE